MTFGTDDEEEEEGLEAALEEVREEGLGEALEEAMAASHSAALMSLSTLERS